MWFSTVMSFQINASFLMKPFMQRLLVIPVQLNEGECDLWLFLDTTGHLLNSMCDLDHNTASQTEISGKKKKKRASNVTVYSVHFKFCVCVCVCLPISVMSLFFSWLSRRAIIISTALRISLTRSSFAPLTASTFLS